jgi:serine/threonine protein kinase
MPQLPRVGDVFGRYRIDAQIGQGGMGVVFSATDTAFDRRVALKVVSAALGGSAEFLARFEREAALLARLNSPHVIAIFDYGEQDGCPYLATQYVGGGDLGGLLAARGPMPPQLAAEVCAQVADALADAHRAGVVHRDVKPTNVLLRDADTLDMHAYLCDFGIARTDSEGLTAPGSVSGTWSYLAPECGTGAPGTVSSDLYALGCLLWAALTGKAPFGGTDVEIAIAHQQAPVPQLAGDDPFTRHVNVILANTLAKDPRARYADADAVRADLLAAAAIPSTGVRPVPPTPPAAVPDRVSADRISLGSLPPGSPLPPPRRRRTALVVAATCLAVLAVAGGIVAVTLTGDDPSGQASPGTDPTTTTSSGSDSPSPSPEPPLVVGPVTGDLDGDGIGDVALRELVLPKKGGPKEGKGVYQLFSWTSTGSAFVDPVKRPDPSPADLNRDLALGDLDGDDVLETIAVDTPARRGAITVTAELSSGSSLSQRLPRPTGGTYVTQFPTDADGDGDDDLLLLAWGKKKAMRMWVATSTGTELHPRLRDPRPAISIRTGYEDSEVEVGDFDGDGLADVAVLTTSDDPDRNYHYTSTLEVHLGQASGGFASDGETRTFPSAIGNAFVSGDFDGDEDIELGLVLDRDSFMQIGVLDHGESGMKRPKGWGLLPMVADSFYDSDVTVGDYDGDGLDDILAIGPSATPKVSELLVALSTGKRFDNATTWATWRFDLVDTYGTEALGETFP